jgi:hypothetical protein
VMATRAPTERKSWAVAKPIPLLPPVIKAVLPYNEKTEGIEFVCMMDSDELNKIAIVPSQIQIDQ